MRLRGFDQAVCSTEIDLYFSNCTECLSKRKLIPKTYLKFPELRATNARLQSEIDVSKEKVAELENPSAGEMLQQVITRVLEESIECEKCRSNLIVYGVPESTSKLVPQRIIHDKSTIKNILEPFGDVIPHNLKLVRLGKKSTDSARPLKLLFDCKETASNLQVQFNTLKRSWYGL